MRAVQQSWQSVEHADNTGRGGEGSSTGRVDGSQCRVISVSGSAVSSAGDGGDTELYRQRRTEFDRHSTAAAEHISDRTNFINYEYVSQRRNNGTSSDGRMSKMTVAMDVDATLDPTSRCRCDVDVEKTY